MTWMVRESRSVFSSLDCHLSLLTWSFCCTEKSTLKLRGWFPLAPTGRVPLINWFPNGTSKTFLWNLHYKALQILHSPARGFQRLIFPGLAGYIFFYCRTLSFCDGKGQEMPPDQWEQVCGVRHLSSSPGMIPLFPVHSFFWNQFLNLGELAFLKTFFSHVFFFLNILIQLKMYSSIAFFLSCAVVFIFYLILLFFYGVVFLPSVYLLSNLVEVKPPLASGLKMPSCALRSLHLQPAREGISVSGRSCQNLHFAFPSLPQGRVSRSSTTSEKRQLNWDK